MLIVWCSLNKHRSYNLEKGLKILKVLETYLFIHSSPCHKW